MKHIPYVLVIIPNDATAIMDVINSAAEKGIAVFLVDSGADDSNYISYIGTDNYAGRILAAQWFEENMTGKVAVIDGAAGNAATPPWGRALDRRLLQAEKICLSVALMVLLMGPRQLLTESCICLLNIHELYEDGNNVQLQV